MNNNKLIAWLGKFLRLKPILPVRAPILKANQRIDDLYSLNSEVWARERNNTITFDGVGLKLQCPWCRGHKNYELRGSGESVFYYSSQVDNRDSTVLYL